MKSGRFSGKPTESMSRYTRRAHGLHRRFLAQWPALDLSATLSRNVSDVLTCTGFWLALLADPSGFWLTLPASCFRLSPLADPNPVPVPGPRTFEPTTHIDCNSRSSTRSILSRLGVREMGQTSRSRFRTEQMGLAVSTLQGAPKWHKG